MIDSYTRYRYYLDRDKLALGIKDDYKSRFKRLFVANSIFKFQKLLRKCEYYKNCRKDIIGRVYYLFIKRKFIKLSTNLGFSIPENVFGPGLAIIHYGTIIINPRAKIGSNCRIHACTNIGESGGEFGAPQIGDNVYLAPGVKIYGDIRVANNIAFAANAAVGKDCLEGDSLYGGVPAKKIKDIDIKRIIKHIRDL